MSATESETVSELECAGHGHGRGSGPTSPFGEILDTRSLGRTLRAHLSIQPRVRYVCSDLRNIRTVESSALISNRILIIASLTAAVDLFDIDIDTDIGILHTNEYIITAAPKFLVESAG